MNELMKISSETRVAMKKAVDNSRRELGTLRGGKANPSMLDTVRVDAYGQPMSLSQVASVATPEPRLITIQPWDKGLMHEIEKAIQSADIGLNPSNDGTIIRIPVPALTEERRHDLVKVAKKLAEEGRIAVRQARSDAIGKVKKVEHVSDDEKHQGEKDVQSVHDEHMGLIDDLVKNKEAEIMEV